MPGVELTLVSTPAGIHPYDPKVIHWVYERTTGEWAVVRSDGSLRKIPRESWGSLHTFREAQAQLGHETRQLRITHKGGGLVLHRAIYAPMGSSDWKWQTANEDWEKV